MARTPAPAARTPAPVARPPAAAARTPATGGSNDRHRRLEHRHRRLEHRHRRLEHRHRRLDDRDWWMTTACTPLPPLTRRLWRLSARAVGRCRADPARPARRRRVLTSRGGEQAFAFFSDASLRGRQLRCSSTCTPRRKTVLTAIDSTVTTTIAPCTGTTATAQTTCANSFVSDLRPEGLPATGGRQRGDQPHEGLRARGDAGLQDRHQADDRGDHHFAVLRLPDGARRRRRPPTRAGSTRTPR